MKQRYFTVVIILLSGCLNSPDSGADMGGDQNNSKDVSEIQETNQRPTADECESHVTESSCFEAGCRIFHDVTVFSSVNEVCTKGVPGTVCWMTPDRDLLPTGLETTYFREESDGSMTVVLTPFGYNQSVIGWESCLGPCLCTL